MKNYVFNSFNLTISKQSHSHLLVFMFDHLCFAQLYVSFPVLTVDAVWGPIPASVPLTITAHNAYCVSKKNHQHMWS